ncbi:MAG: hypothetical protein Q7K45_04820 [Nanoarchaeota archaeon]|nr:hypothetical protein [Nanoarchaeota archaeon]
MGLDAQLCQKARDLYGWEMKFEGDFKSDSPVINISEWFRMSECPAISIGLEHITKRPTYGFVDLNSQEVPAFQPFATVYASRMDDFQEDLIRAALLHLRKDISEKPASITFPSPLQGFVRSYHLWLLQPDNQEVKEFPGGIVPIYRERSITSISEVLDSLKINDNAQE